jgi:pSer/pThr/pTyr-binding forkhead associated (FHA) protein
MVSTRSTDHLGGPTSSQRHFLDDVTVSRKHAEFRSNNGDDFHIVDLGSLNGTYVNQEAVDSAVLVSGDEIALGKFRLTFLITLRSNAGAFT